MTSTVWPSSESSAATVCSVRTTPFTCGRQASETMRMREEGPTASRRARASLALRLGCVSGSLRQADGARREERKSVAGGPVDQFDPAVLVFDEGGAAFHPVAVVHVHHAVDFAHFGVVDMAAHHTVE